jgi:hypothetical protein
VRSNFWTRVLCCEKLFETIGSIPADSAWLAQTQGMESTGMPRLAKRRVR